MDSVEMALWFAVTGLCLALLCVLRSLHDQRLVLLHQMRMADLLTHRLDEQAKASIEMALHVGLIDVKRYKRLMAIYQPGTN